MEFLKKAKKVIFDGCAIGTFICLAFCLFIKVSNTLEKPAMTVGQYLIIVLFGMLIACANLLFSIHSIPSLLVRLIHFLALLVSFYIIFILASSASFPSATQLVVGFVLFSFFYALISLCVWLIRRMTGKTSTNAQTENSQENYTPLYR